jgi:hypothetical protein
VSRKQSIASKQPTCRCLPPYWSIVGRNEGLPSPQWPTAREESAAARSPGTEVPRDDRTMAPEPSDAPLQLDAYSLAALCALFQILDEWEQGENPDEA